MTYRILTLDGGGAWAILEAMALQKIYGDVNGLQILKKFDLVGSNSGGSIVLGALIANKKPSQIIDMFLDDDERAKIFVKRSGGGIPGISKYWRLFGIGPRYKTSGKREGIAAVLGPSLADKPMSQLGTLLGNTNVFIMGFDYDWLRAEFYRSFDNLADSKASTIALADAINASSTAPVNYFDEPATANDDRRHWDGGLGGYNNPILAAIVEARIAGKTPDEIVALSIGTGTVRKLRKDHPGTAPDKYVEPCDEAPSLIRDIKQVATAILDDPPDAASYTAYIMLGNTPKPGEGTGSGQIVRLNPLVQARYDAAQNTWGPEPGLNPNDFDALFEMDSDAAGVGDVPKIQSLGNAWMNPQLEYPNQPVRVKLPLLTCEVGDPTFEKGWVRWEKLSGHTRPVSAIIA